MWEPFSALAQETITRSHSITIRGTAYGATIGMLTDLPISGGVVTVDATSQVRRIATVSIGRPDLWPANPTDVLSPLGSELFLEYGVVLPGVGVEWVPLIRGVISDADRERPVVNSDGSLTLSLDDRSSKVAEDRLDAPAQTAAGATTVAEIRRLIQESLPDVAVTDLTGSTQIAPTLDIERERWADGIEKLADSIAAEVYVDPQGDFVIRPQPQITDPSVWEVRSGRGGILVAKKEKLTREKVFNKVVAFGQRSDGTPPVRAAVADTDPTSPTFYGGAFGRKPRFYTSPLLTTTQQCIDAATALLARVQGMQASVELQAIVNPALDAGDVITVRDAGKVQQHIIDRLTIPLKLGQAQQLTTRSLDLPPEV